MIHTRSGIVNHVVAPKRGHAKKKILFARSCHSLMCLFQTADTASDAKHRQQAADGSSGYTRRENEICARVGYFKLGINLRTENPKPEKIRKAVLEVLGNPVYQKNVKTLSAEFARYNPYKLCEQFIGNLPVTQKQ